MRFLNKKKEICELETGYVFSIEHLGEIGKRKNGFSEIFIYIFMKILKIAQRFTQRNER